jgi:hypothetical protein
MPQADPKNVLHPLPPKYHLTLRQLRELKHDALLRSNQLPNNRAWILRLRVHRRLMNRVPGLQQSFAVSVVCPVGRLDGAIAVGVGSFCGEFESCVDVGRDAPEEAWPSDGLACCALSCWA